MGSSAIPAQMTPFFGRKMSSEKESKTVECSVCSSDFNPEEEDGITGFFGILPVFFCVWCYASITDMVEQNCLQCQLEEEDSFPSIIN